MAAAGFGHQMSLTAMEDEKRKHPDEIQTQPGNIGLFLSFYIPKKLVHSSENKK